jgi:hypothetical protein
MLYRLIGGLRLLWKPATALATTAVAALELFHLGEDTVHQPNVDSFAVIYLGCVITAAFGYAIYRVVATIRKEKYANITPHIHDVNHGIRDLLTFMEQQIPTSVTTTGEFELFQPLFRNRLIDILTHIAHMFSVITGTKCRACLKTMFTHQGVIYMQTLARDKRSDGINFNRDEKRRDDLMDPIARNSEFLRMVKIEKDGPGIWHFFCNDLPSNKNFQSTSFDAYDPGKQNPTLPYGSTICCAIGQAPRPGIKGIVGGTGESTIVIGFLAVDSESRGVFRERWDVELLYSFSDAFVWPLKRYIDAFRKVTSSSNAGRTSPPATSLHRTEDS